MYRISSSRGLSLEQRRFLEAFASPDGQFNDKLVRHTTQEFERQFDGVMVEYDLVQTILGGGNGNGVFRLQT